MRKSLWWVTGARIPAWRAVLALALALALVAPAAAQSDIITNLTHARMRTILLGMGIQFTEELTADRSAFRLQLEGYSVTLTNNFSSIELLIRFSQRLSLGRVNEWNQKYNFSRAFINESGDAHLKAELDLEGGTTRTAIEQFIRTFRGSLRLFVQFLAMPETDTGGYRAPASQPTTPSRPAAPTYRRSSLATSRNPAGFGDFVLWTNPLKWTKQASTESGVMQFNHITGEGWGRVISEKVSIPTNALKEIALENAKKADPNARVTFEERRVVNGRQLICLQIEGIIRNIPFRYYGYYYGGSSGTIQVITYTIQTSFDKLFSDFTEFLNGLEIYDTELSSGATGGTTGGANTYSSSLADFSFNNNRMKLTYDKNKWKPEQSTDAGRFLFDHTGGNGYGLIIAESLTIPMESLPEIALSNARDQDPNARITFREKRFVNGNEVWLLKIEATVRQIPVTYMGYYYSGRQGTVQVLTYSGRSLFAEHERDFMEFLNGFRALP
jgi:hypothetical protein